MGKDPHNFREFFTLIDSPKKTANKRAVCNFCIKEYTFSVASIKISCFVSNKAKLCRGHLIKCANFNNQVSESERNEILVRSVPKDTKKATKKQKIDREKNVNVTDKSGIENLIIFAKNEYLIFFNSNIINY